MSKLYKVRRTGELLLEVSSHELNIKGSEELEMVVLCKSGTSETMTISRCALHQIADVVD